MDAKKIIEEKINQLITGIGAMAEFIGIMRNSLMANGFTREEAVAMCTAAMIAMITPNNKEKDE